MASSPFNSSAMRLDSSSSGVRCASGLLPSDGVPSTQSRRHDSLTIQSPKFWIEAQKSDCDMQICSAVSRSRNGALIAGFMAAATSAFGLSLVLPNGLAIAAELEASRTAAEIVSNSVLDPSISSHRASGLSFSMAIPIPHEQEWIIVSRGRQAPYPETQSQGIAHMSCPPWTPTKLEMFLPDFNGRPKPFPRRGHHWSATFAEADGDIDAGSHLSELKEDVQNESMEMGFSSMKAKLDAQKEDGLTKMLGTGRFKCFSM